MKQVFELAIDGIFTQYLMKSETKLIPLIFEPGRIITLTCVEITKEKYDIVFGKK